ncbi:MAG: DUF1295 domain-containing protein [Chloroflexi bacterium]|nr:DUF1295 domain-containing protein [Chloroflexota bacterium]
MKTPSSVVGLLIASFVVAVGTFALLFFVSAPYGRHARQGWGPTVRNRWGWVLMESPSAVAMLVFFMIGARERTVTRLVLFGLWELHYAYRAFLYPFRLRSDSRSMPLLVALMGMGFNAFNASLNGNHLFVLSECYTLAWLIDGRFIVGIALFLAGLGVNRAADATLRRLRAPGEIGYSIPYGGLYRWVSCPNYFGEIVQWVGWALATWSLPGLAFAVWTTANLAPRARSHHRWYREHFADYPPERKALLPGIW